MQVPWMTPAGARRSTQAAEQLSPQSLKRKVSLAKATEGDTEGVNSELRNYWMLFVSHQEARYLGGRDSASELP